MTPDRDVLQECVSELIDGWQRGEALLARLQALFPEQSALVQEGKKHGKISVSPAPWNDQAAGLFFDVAAGTREHEGNLTYLAYSRIRSRPDTDEHTRASLRQLPDLISHCQQLWPTHTKPERASMDLQAWPRRIRALLDEAQPGEEQPTRAPGGLVCPHCARTLVIEPGWQNLPNPQLRCTHCRADNGDRLAWPATQWLGVLQDIEDAPRPVRDPYPNTGSGRA